jgi:3-oxoacyl-[acyl-carrier-protein] synthase-3
MMTNVKIKSIEIYHPDHTLDNEYFIEHFKKHGKDVGAFLDFMGKKSRYVINNKEETGLTMAIEASRKALESADLTIKEIDMIFFTTQVPEYSVPTNAMMIHEALRGKSDTRVMDINASCAGMTVAIEQASLYMKVNPNIQHTLVVGSEQLSILANPEEEISYAMFGDASCAVVLERTEEKNTGFIDAEYHTYSANTDKILYPIEGMSKVLQGKGNGRYLRFVPFDSSFGAPITDRMIEDILKRNHMKIGDIDAFCLSQLAYADSLRIQERFNLDMDKIIYIGDKYGYTGTTSPLISLYEGIQQGRIKRGDTVLFWTVGAGHQFIVMLFKY